ncbi:MAG: hypothetical protein JW861_10860 [Bacteroidales bacterium]|nr:hypothetical protein [Bacteroidales bacterium]
MNLSFFRLPKPRQFRYPPRYFDEEKERLEQRKRELGLLAGGDREEPFSARLSHEWRRQRRKEDDRLKARRNSLLIYLFILAILVYFIFFA